MPPTFSAGSASVNIVPDFRNAQQAISRWFGQQNNTINVPVNPNLNQTALARIQGQIAGIPNKTVHIDLDSHQFLREFAKITDTMVGITAVEEGFRKVFGPKSVLMVNGVGALTAVAGAAAQAGGALALLPAGIAAAVVPIATITLGVQGMGEAFKAVASGDIEKINEAMRNLAPAAQDFVTQVHSLAPAFKDLRLDVQQALFQGLGRDVAALGHNYLPMLSASLPAVAEGLRGVAQSFIGMLNQAKNVEGFKTVIDNVAASTGAWGQSASAVGQIWIDLSVVGSSFLPRLSAGFADLAVKAADWVTKARESGVLTQIIEQAIQTLTQLGHIVVNVGQVLFQVFSAAAGTGGMLLDIINKLIGQFAAFLATDVGQSGLHTFFTNIGIAVQALMPGLQALLQALVTGILPAISGLAAAIAPLAGTILTQLADMITRLAPLFYPAMANAVQSVLEALSPLIPIITEIAEALFPVLTEVMLTLAPVISTVAEAFGQALLMAFHALEPLLPLIMQGIKDILAAVMPLIPALLELIQAVLPPLTSLFAAVIPVVVEIATAVLPALINVVQALTPLLKILADVVSWVFSTIIGPVITFIVNNVVVPLINLMAAVFTAMANALKWAWENIIKPAWDALALAARFLWENVLKPVWDAMQNAWNALMLAMKVIWETVLRPVWEAIRAAAEFLWNTILKPIFDAIGAVWDALMRAMRVVYDNVLHPMWTIFTDAIHAVQTAFEAVRDGIAAAWNAVKAIAATPINFVIEYVFNKGLFAAWNWLVDTLHLPFGHAHFDQIHGEGIPNFAYGGQVTDQQDVRGGGRVRGKARGPRADNTLALLTPDEYVIQQPVARRIRPFLDALNSGQPEAVQAAGGWYANPSALKVPAYAAGGNVQNALNIAQQMIGRPYVWGGASYTGADCSGFQSIMTRAIRGEANPYRRVGTTATFPWPGFQNGFGTPYTIGNTKNAFNSGVGHMAGTIDGHKVESGSGHGPMLDRNALGADAPLFGMHAFLNNISGAVFTGEAGITEPWYVTLWHSVEGAWKWLEEHVTSPIGDLFKKFSDFPLTQVITGVPKTMLTWVWDAVKGAIADLFLQGQDRAPGDAVGIKSDVSAIAQNRGWQQGTNFWNGIDFIVENESGWNPKAQNPTSTASGLFQQIDSTWRANRPIAASAVAHMKDARVVEQAQAGLKYIADRYHDPNQAMAFWKSHHYYDRGGWIPPGLSTVWNATGRPEPVLTAGEHDALVRWRNATYRGRGEDVARALIAGGLHFHGAGERKAGEIMDELWHRINVAQRGGVNATATVYTVG